MKKSMFLLLIVCMAMGLLLVACSSNNERPDAETMTLNNEPPLQPANHEGRWNPELRADSCRSCHTTKGDIAIPKNHFKDSNVKKGLEFENCFNCHPIETK